MTYGHCVYRLRDVEDELLYIGSTDYLKGRIWSHRRKQSWGYEIHRVTSEPYGSRESAREAERQAIETEKPRYNRNHNYFAVKTPRNGVPAAPELLARIGQLKDNLSHAPRLHDYIVELHQLGVGTTELARLAGMARSGIDAILKRKAQS